MSANVASVKRTKSSKQTAPITIKHGSLKFTIYRVRNGANYERFSVVYREADGAWRMRHFSDSEEAKRKAELIATRLANGQTDALQLRNADVAKLLSARELLAPLNFTVNQAVTDFVAASKRLPAGASLF